MNDTMSSVDVDFGGARFIGRMGSQATGARSIDADTEMLGSPSQELCVIPDTAESRLLYKSCPLDYRSDASWLAERSC